MGVLYSVLVNNTMPSFDLDPAFTALVTSSVSAESVLLLRRKIYGDGVINLKEAEQLFLINDQIGDVDCPEWSAFFTEAVTDLVLQQSIPYGYVSEENAKWLMERITKDSAMSLRTEFEALLKVMENAVSVPQNLAAFALEQVKSVIMSGQGMSLYGEAYEPGRVTAADVKALRRVLYAASSEGFNSISREEAEILFDIAQQTSSASNDPSFDDLFARAIGNHVMSGAGWSAPSMAIALRRERWLDEQHSLGGGVADFFGRALGGMGSAFTSLLSHHDQDKSENPLLDTPDDMITHEEADWIAARINRDGIISSAEKNLLRFLKSEASHLAPSLQSLMDKAA
jgi:hypothetical protein